LNEYRFGAGNEVTVYTYKHVADTKYAKVDKGTVVLLGAFSNVSIAALSIVTSVSLLSF